MHTWKPHGMLSMKHMTGPGLCLELGLFSVSSQAVVLQQAAGHIRPIQALLGKTDCCMWGLSLHQIAQDSQLAATCGWAMFLPTVPGTGQAVQMQQVTMSSRLHGVMLGRYWTWHRTECVTGHKRHQQEEGMLMQQFPLGLGRGMQPSMLLPEKPGLRCVLLCTYHAWTVDNEDRETGSTRKQALCC